MKKIFLALSMFTMVFSFGMTTSEDIRYAKSGENCFEQFQLSLENNTQNNAPFSNTTGIDDYNFVLFDCIDVALAVYDAAIAAGYSAQDAYDAGYAVGAVCMAVEMM